MKIAITGATGFIGQNLTRYLQSRHLNVIALVREKSPHRSCLQAGIETRSGDVTRIDQLRVALQQVDVLIHLAALFNRPEESWESYRAVNVEGTRNVLEAAKLCKVRRVIHCSTGGVVASGKNAPFSESAPYATPNWNKYETTKRQAEQIALQSQGADGPEIVVLRPTQPFGPGDKAKAKFYRMVKKGIIVNPGQTKKHLIYIDDLCRAFEIAATHSAAAGQIFHIGAPEPIYLRQLVSVVADALGVSYPRIVLPSYPVHLAARFIESICRLCAVNPPISRRSIEFFNKSVAFDVSNAQNRLHFSATTDIYTGVRRTAAWYYQNNLL